MKSFYKKYYESSFKMLKYLGIWSQNVDKKSTKIYYTYCFVVNFLFIFMSNFIQLIHIMIQREFKHIISCSYAFPLTCIPVMKSYFFFKNRIEIQKIQQRFIDFQVEDDTDFIKNTMKIYLALKKATECLAATIIIIDTTTMFYGYYDVLPLWFPNLSSPAREIMCIYNIISLTYIATTYIYFQLICSGVFIFIGMQCDLYCKYLSQVKQLDEILLKQLVQRYENLTSLFSLSEKVFSEIFFIEIICISLGLCLRLLMISMTENFMELPIHISSLVLVFLLILLPCWFSTTVTTKSDRISTSIYSLPWYNCQSLKVKKDLVQFIRMAERPIEFTAMGLVTLSNDTFIKIMRTTFSFYTFLDFLNGREAK